MKNKRWFWLIAKAKFEGLTVSIAFDLLRYDGARVESNAPEGFFLFSTDAESHHYGPNLQRLSSHGIRVDWVIDKPALFDLGSSRAWEWFHANSANRAKGNTP